MVCKIIGAIFFEYIHFSKPPLALLFFFLFPAFILLENACNVGQQYDELFLLFEQAYDKFKLAEESISRGVTLAGGTVSRLERKTYIEHPIGSIPLYPTKI